MKKYFIFNGKDSRDFEIYLEEYPPIVKPKERVDTITVPGRSGTLHMREAEGVYESYTKRFEIIAVNPARIDEIKEWLKGAGELVIGNELDYIYSAYINAEIEFARFFRDWHKAVIPIEVQPYKASKNKKKVAFTKNLTEFNVNSANAEALAFKIFVKKPASEKVIDVKFSVEINGEELIWLEAAILKIIVNNVPDSAKPSSDYCAYTSVDFGNFEVVGEAVIDGIQIKCVTNEITYKNKPYLKNGKNTIRMKSDRTFESAYIEYNEVKL